jgi:hypothetical protein
MQRVFSEFRFRSWFARYLLRYFIDRDAEYFPLVLNYLRSGEIYIPSHMDSDRLLQEAEYYGLETLSAVLKKKKRRTRDKSIGLASDVVCDAGPTSKFHSDWFFFLKLKLSDVLRQTTMETWKTYAESKYKEYLPKIMEKLQGLTKTHPFFEAEFHMTMDTTTPDDVNKLQVMAQYRDVGSSFLIMVPLKFVGQPICERMCL